MGGPGKGVSVPVSSPVSRVEIAFNRDASSRPYSLRNAYDPGANPGQLKRAEWDRTALGRQRTFATAEAAIAAATAAASAPLVVEHVVQMPAYEPTQEQRDFSRQTRAEVDAVVAAAVQLHQDGVPVPQSESDRAAVDREIARRAQQSLSDGALPTRRQPWET